MGRAYLISPAGIAHKPAYVYAGPSKRKGREPALGSRLSVYYGQKSPQAGAGITGGDYI